MKYYPNLIFRYFSEEKTKLDADWRNVNQKVTMMKKQYVELRTKIDSLSVCF